MTGADLLPTISASLIKAAQLSYVEDAPGTRSILEKLNIVLRYTKRGPGNVRLNEEWSIMINFLELQRIQNPDRFTYDICDDIDVPKEFIPRCRLFSQLHAEFLLSYERYEGLLTFSLRILSSSPLEVELMITTKDSKRSVIW